MWTSLLVLCSLPVTMPVVETCTAASAMEPTLHDATAPSLPKGRCAFPAPLAYARMLTLAAAGLIVVPDEGSVFTGALDGSASLYGLVQAGTQPPASHSPRVVTAPTLLTALDRVNPTGQTAFTTGVGYSFAEEDWEESSASDLSLFNESDSENSVTSRSLMKARRAHTGSHIGDSVSVGAPPPPVTAPPATTMTSAQPPTESGHEPATVAQAEMDPATRLRGDMDNHTIALRQEAIANMLQFYSDKGDVQTCTTVMCVLSGSAVFPTCITQKQHTLWTRGYIGEWAWHVV